ncbi:MAG: sulfurtransferase-like selenium metabolism protein YedF [Eubacteriales bacterium]|nr:sulfurtransferase-like selenium metabolism protein YedF [Eubacteriales bacterium]
MIKVDAMGEACPIPVIKTKKALDSLTGPSIVQTHVDNEVAVQNLSKLAGSRSMEVSSEKVEEKHFVVTIRAEGAPQPAQADEPTACIPDARENIVVAVGSALMGSGDPELGKVLMKSFLYAVSQMDKLPKTILFYNGGATIPIQGSDSLDDLRSLEAMGVQIRTCGTCLNFYGLTDKLAVGEVSNMYDIVETLAGASKVIRP